MPKYDNKEFKFHTYMGNNLAYDILCELTCLDNLPPHPDLQAEIGAYFPKGVMYAAMVVIIIANPMVSSAISAAAGMAE